MDNKQTLFIEFKVDDRQRFEKLYRVFKALKEDKQKQIDAWNSGEEGEDAFRDDNEWLAFFDEEARTHFQWSTEEENAAWLERWYATPLETRWTDPSLKRPWSLFSMIEAFKNGEYELISCELVSSDMARLEYNPLAFPYGGTGCMKALVEAFGFHVAGKRNGPGYGSSANW